MTLNISRQDSPNNSPEVDKDLSQNQYILLQ